MVLRYLRLWWQLSGRALVENCEDLLRKTWVHQQRYWFDPDQVPQQYNEWVSLMEKELSFLEEEPSKLRPFFSEIAARFEGDAAPNANYEDAPMRHHTILPSPMQSTGYNEHEVAMLALPFVQYNDPRMKGYDLPSISILKPSNNEGLLYYTHGSQYELSIKSLMMVQASRSDVFPEDWFRFQMKNGKSNILEAGSTREAGADEDAEGQDNPLMYLAGVLASGPICSRMHHLRIDTVVVAGRLRRFGVGKLPHSG